VGSLVGSASDALHLDVNAISSTKVLPEQEKVVCHAANSDGKKRVVLVVRLIDSRFVSVFLD
jgi:hypothetical protein